MGASKDLDRQIQATQQRLQEMQRRAGGNVEQNPLLAEAIAELSISLEELQITTEELYQQNEELLASRQALETERQCYQNLFDFAPNAYLVTDGQGVIQAINGAAEVLFNIRRDYAQKKPLILFVSEVDRAFIHTQIDRIAQFAPKPQRLSKSQLKG